MKNKNQIAIIATFIWIGFVGSISFMESWLKFQAEGITVPLGLGIGRLVFNALNKMEWVFAVIIAVNFMYSKQKLFSARNFLYFIPLLILIVQTIWLLPLLDARAALHIQNQFVPKSNLHFYYPAMEVVKTVCLFVLGINLFKTAG